MSEWPDKDVLAAKLEDAGLEREEGEEWVNEIVTTARSEVKELVEDLVVFDSYGNETRLDLDRVFQAKGWAFTPKTREE